VGTGKGKEFQIRKNILRNGRWKARGYSEQEQHFIAVRIQKKEQIAQLTVGRMDTTAMEERRDSASFAVRVFSVPHSTHSYHTDRQILTCPENTSFPPPQNATTSFWMLFSP